MALTKQIIEQNANNPEYLEQLYHESPEEFRSVITELSIEAPEAIVWRIWSARLNYEKQPVKKRIRIDYRFIVMVVIGFLTATFIKIATEFYWFTYSIATWKCWIGSIFFMLILYLIITQEHKALFRAMVISIAGALYLFLILLPEPDFYKSHVAANDLIMLTYYHVPLCFWTLTGVSYLGHKRLNAAGRIEFIETNGAFAILVTVILIGGIILVILTASLFKVLDMDIWSFLNTWVVVYGIVCAPFFAFYFAIKLNKLINPVMPVIARIFSFLATIVLLIYTALFIPDFINYKGYMFSEPSSLSIMNIALFSTLALTVFSICERSDKNRLLFFDYVNILMIFLAAVIGLLTFGANTVQLAVKGISPFRLDATVITSIILVNLTLLLIKYIGIMRNKAASESLAMLQGNYMIVYAVYAFAAIIVFPVASIFIR